MTHASLRNVPSVDALLRGPRAQALVREHGQSLVVRCARALQTELRDDLMNRKPAPASSEASGVHDAQGLDLALANRATALMASSLRPLLNLSGTVIHTNLGRALLADAAVQRVLSIMTAPANLEYDLATGSRGDRDSIVEGLLCELTGAEAATVVNNNAGAVLLTIFALARSCEVVVSRGELVEIGGAFRMPDVMEAAGAHMVEIGTTNRTHAQDYERALNERTGLIMKVHTSNYVIRGFTAAVGEAQLAEIAHAHGIPVAIDLGSGSLVDMAAHGLPAEPMPQQMVKAGCDVVTFSGDKLLGGPQAGLIVGRSEAIARIRKCPLKRALRMSKLPLAALEATLQLYRRPERLLRDLPTLRLLTRSPLDIEVMARRICPLLADTVSPRFEVVQVQTQSQIGSGSLPEARLPSAGLAMLPVGVSRKGRMVALEQLATALRSLPRPVLGRISEDRLLLDLRCLEQPDELTCQLPLLRQALLDT